MSSSSLESIIVNAKRLAQRLKSREADADRILAEAEEVNNQLETMRQVSITTDIHSIFNCVSCFYNALFLLLFFSYQV